MKELLKTIYLFIFKIRYKINSLFIRENENTVLFISEFDNTLKHIEKRYSNQMYNKYYIKKGDSLKSQIKKMNKAKYIYTDNYNVFLAYINQKKVKIQVWHAAIAIKKIGFDAKNTSKSKIAQKRFQRVYDSINYYICSSKHMKETFMKSFNQPEEKMLILGYPKFDNYLDKTFLEEVEKYKVINSQYLEKLNILYAPTFRNNDEGNEKQLNFINKLSKELKDEYNILFKAHNKTNISLEEIEADVIYKDLDKFISLSDIIITDYSSVAFDAIALNKKVIYYTYDFENYAEDPGLNIDPNELIGTKCSTYKEVILAIRKSENQKKEMDEKYFIKNMEGGLHKVITSIIKAVNK